MKEEKGNIDEERVVKLGDKGSVGLDLVTGKGNELEFLFN